jgi:hypothetical protein
MLMLFLILLALCIPMLGLGARANLIAAIVLIVLGVLLVFTGWDGNLQVRVHN